MVDGVRGLAGQLAQLLVEVVSVAEQGLVTAPRQLTKAANARLTGQVTLKQKSATPIHAQVLTYLSISEIGIDWVICHRDFNCS